MLLLIETLKKWSIKRLLEIFLTDLVTEEDIAVMVAEEAVIIEVDIVAVKEADMVAIKEVDMVVAKEVAIITKVVEDITNTIIKIEKAVIMEVVTKITEATTTKAIMEVGIINLTMRMTMKAKSKKFIPRRINTFLLMSTLTHFKNEKG